MAVDLKQALVNLETALRNEKAVGYGIAIYRSGRLELSTSGGFAVVGAGSTPAKHMKSTVRLSMHSMGKTLSAAAMIHALDSQGRSVDDRSSRSSPLPGSGVPWSRV